MSGSSKTMKQWVEKVKTVTPGLKEDGPAWKPTSNERNTLMLREARTYSHALQSLHRDLTSWDKNVKITLNSICNLLKAGLPRVFDEAASGAAFPSTREHRVVASDVPVEVLVSASTVLRDKMSRDVLKPLEQWMEAYKKIKEDNSKVEELRSELDMRRRSHAQVQYKVDKLTAVVTSPRETVSEPKAEAKQEAKYEAKADKLEEKHVQLATEEDKTARMVQRYADAEAFVFQSVYALIQDVHVLRDYAAAAITLMQDTFTAALHAFQDGPAAAQEEWVLQQEGGLGAFVGRPLVAKSPLQERVLSSRRATEDDTDSGARLSFPAASTMSPNVPPHRASLEPHTPGTPSTTELLY